jgi:hypothetical protein
MGSGLFPQGWTHSGDSPRVLRRSGVLRVGSESDCAAIRYLDGHNLYEWGSPASARLVPDTSGFRNLPWWDHGPLHVCPRRDDPGPHNRAGVVTSLSAVRALGLTSGVIVTSRHRGRLSGLRFAPTGRDAKRCDEPERCRRVGELEGAGAGARVRNPRVVRQESAVGAPQQVCRHTGRIVSSKVRRRPEPRPAACANRSVGSHARRSHLRLNPNLGLGFFAHGLLHKLAHLAHRVVYKCRHSLHNFWSYEWAVQDSNL